MSLSSPQVNSTLKKGPRQDGRQRPGSKTPAKAAATSTTSSLLNISSLVAKSPDVAKQSISKPARKTTVAQPANSLPNMVILDGLGGNLSASLPKIITTLPASTSFSESINTMLATFPPFDARDLVTQSLPPVDAPFGQQFDPKASSGFYLIPTGHLPGSKSIADPFSYAKDPSGLAQSRLDDEIAKLACALEGLTVELEKKIARPGAVDSLNPAVKEHLLNLVNRLYKCLRQDGQTYDEEPASLTGNLAGSLTGNLSDNLPANLTGSLTGNLNNEFFQQIYGLNLSSLRPFAGAEQSSLTGLSLKDLNNNNILASIASLNSPVSINSPTTSSTTNQKQEDDEKEELFPNGGHLQAGKSDQPTTTGAQSLNEDDLQKQLGEEFLNSCDEYIIDHRKNINQNRIKSSIIGAVKHKQQNLIKKQQSMDDKAPINLTINSPDALANNPAGPANPRRSIRCDLCGTDFTQRNSLNRHIRSHTGEKPFPCKVCEKKFSDKQRLLIHTRIHTGEKPFSCQICARSFTQKSTVKRHLIVHFGQGSSTTNPNFNNALNLKKKVKTGKTARTGRKPSRRSKPDGGQQDVKREQ